MIYFTADTHYYHKNIIGLTCRPFKDINAMHKTLIDNYNEIVTDNDICYFVGDFVFSTNVEQLKDMINKLHGKKVLILGNHDYFKPEIYVNYGFDSVHTSLHPLDKVILNHDPAIYCTLKDEKLLLCGHVHTLFKKVLKENDVLIYNVGVDVNEFRPVCFKDLITNEVRYNEI